MDLIKYSAYVYFFFRSKKGASTYKFSCFLCCFAKLLLFFALPVLFLKYHENISDSFLIFTYDDKSELKLIMKMAKSRSGHVPNCVTMFGCLGIYKRTIWQKKRGLNAKL